MRGGGCSERIQGQFLGLAQEQSGGPKYTFGPGVEAVSYFEFRSVMTRN